MQALIDFDGWRKWKDFAEANGLKDPSKPAGASVKLAKKALKQEAAKKPEDKVPITATGEASRVPDPKSLDSRGLEAVGSPPSANAAAAKKEEGADTKDFVAVKDIKGEELKKESPNTVVHSPTTGETTETSS